MNIKDEPAPEPAKDGPEVVGWRQTDGDVVSAADMILPDKLDEPLVRQSALTACQQEVERLQAELSGNTGELIDKMAEAIRGDTVCDDTPWESLSEDRKIGWRGDAERALAVVKEYLTAPRHRAALGGLSNG